MASRTLKVEIIGNADSLSAALGRASGVTEAFGARMQSLGGSLKSVGSTLTRDVTLPIVAIGGLSAKAAIDFQNAMELIHTQAQVPQKDIAALSNAVLSLAGPTATAPDVLAAGLYHLASQGLRGAKAIDVLRVAAEGAKMGQADLEDVTNALGAALTSGIKGVESYTKTMGQMNAIVGSGDMRMQDLADALGKGLVASAKLAGVSFDQLGAALAVFGDANIRGAYAGTLLNSTIRLLNAPSGHAITVLNGMGVSADVLRNKLASGGLTGAIGYLRDRMEAVGITGPEVGAKLSAAFGGKQATGIKLLYDEFDRLQAKLKMVDDGGAKFASDWEAYTKTAAYHLASLGAAMQASGITIGDILLPAVSLVVNKISEAVQWFDRFSSGTKRLILIFAGVAAAIGPVLGTLGSLITVIGFLATPLGLAVAGFAALVGAVAYFAATSPGFRAELVKIADDVKSKWPEIKQVAEEVFPRVEQVIVDFVTLVKDLWDRFGKQLVDDATKAWNDIKGQVKNALLIIEGIFEVADGLLTLNWRETWNGIKHIFEGVWGEIKDAVEHSFTSLINNIRGYAGLAESAARFVGDGIYKGIVAGLKALEKLGEWIIGKLRTALSDAAKWAAGGAAAIGRAIAEGIAHGITSVGGSVEKAAEDVVSSAYHHALSFLHINSPSLLFSQGVGEPIGEGIAHGITQTTGLVSSAVTNSIGAATAAGKQAISSAKTQFNAAWSSFQADVVSAFDKMQKKIQTPTEKLLASFNSTQNAQQFRGDLAEAQSQLNAAMSTAGAKQASPQQLQALGDAQIKVGLAQDALTAAIKKYGAASDQAAKATVALHTAQDGLAKAQAALPDQSDEVAQAFARMTAAQQALEAATAQYGATSKQAVAAANALATATADAQVAVAKEDPNSQQGQNDQAAVDAQKNVNSLLFQQQQQALQQKADAERNAANARIAQQEKDLTRALTLLKNHLENTKQAQGKTQEEIIKLLKSYGITYQNAGEALGDAFAKGLDNAVGKVEAAAKKLAATADAYLPHSPAKKGPLSRLPGWDSYLLPGLESAAAKVSGVMNGLSAPTGGGLAFAGGTAGGVTINVNVSGSVIGSNKQQLAHDLADLVEPHITRRRVSLGV